MKYKDGDTRVKFLFGILMLSILFVLVVYFGIKQQEVREKYRLDYILEDKVVKEIETNKIVDLEKLAKIKFSKITVYPSYSSIKDFKSFINDYNKVIPKDYFNYIVF